VNKRLPHNISERMFTCQLWISIGSKMSLDTQFFNSHERARPCAPLKE